MTKNMGSIDRTIRVLAGVVVLALYFMHYLSGTLALVLGAIAIIFIVTSFVGWCPAYAPFGWSTRKGDSGK